MPPQNQNTGQNVSLELTPNQPPVTGQYYSSPENPLESGAESQPQVVQLSKKSLFSRPLPYVVGLVAIVVLAMPFVVWNLYTRNKAAIGPEVANLATLYPTTALPLEEFSTDTGVNFSDQNVTVNGTLQANNSIILAPTAQPANPVAGQIYFDQTSNVLAYYDGSGFVPVVSGDGELTTINGTSGDITLGAGLSLVGGSLANTGVTSLQGATGDLTLLPGAGISIDGLTINNGGVTSIQGQTGSVSLTAGNGISISGTTINNNGVLDLLAGTTNVIINDNGDGTRTISVDTPPGGGNVTTSGGTAGAIPLFTSANNIEDSAITQSGLTVTITGDLSVSTGGLSLANALTVSNGGTGTTSLTANGVLVGHGTSAISSVATGTPNLCLVSTAGAPTWAACPGAGGVTSLNGQNGVANIANASGAGGTITIDDASTSTKGIASFEATNFSVTSGNVNTIQDIDTTATPTFAGINTSAINPSGTLAVSGDVEVQGGTLTLGGALVQGGLDIYDNSGNRAIVVTAADLLTDITYTLPVPSGAATSAEICLSTGNCAGAGAAITGSGTAGRLAIFDASQNITDSSISESGASINVLSTITNFALQGGGLSVGSATTPGAINIYSDNGNAITINTAAGLGADYTYSLPDVGQNADICLSTGNCIGGGGGGAPSDAQYLTLATDPDLTNERSIAIGSNLTSTDGGAGGNYTIATVQNPTFTTSVTTPTLQSSGALNISSTAGLTVTPGSGVALIDGDLNLSSGNQYQINGTQISSAALSNDSNLAKLSQSQTFTGANNTFQNVSNSTSAFSVQNAAGTSIFAVDSSNNQIVLGTSQIANGTIVFNDISSLNNVTLEPVNLTSNRTIQLPDDDGVICLDTGNCAGAGATLQTAYNFSSSATSPKIKVNSTLLGVDIQDADVSINDNLFTVRSSNGAGLGQPMFAVHSSGSVTLQNDSNSTTAFQVLTQGGTNVLSADTTNGRIALGQDGVLTGQIVFNHSTATTFSGSLVQGGLSDNQIYTLPNATGTICLSSGNCAGQGGYVTIAAGQGTTGTIPIFTGANEIGDSIVSQSSGTVAIGGDLSVSGLGSFQDGSNTTSAFVVLNSTSVPLFQIDTTNNRAYVGNPTADATGALLVLDTKNTSGDPTGVNGGMYYNSNSNKFRCFENSAWANCIGGGVDAVAFNSSGTFTKANYPGMKGIIVEGVGGGGGGGGAYVTTGLSYAWMGGGGGGGGYFKRYIPAASLAASETVTVGTGGAGAEFNDSTPFGTEGTPTSFGSFCTANGGERGSHISGSVSGLRGTGSAGGTASGSGCLVISGGASITAVRVDGNLMSAGIGGSSQLSGQPTTGAGYQLGFSGLNGLAYGGGGGGGWNLPNDSSTFEGGDGADGIVIITIYY